MTRKISYLMLSLACMVFGFAITSCGNDDEPPQDPVGPDFSIEFGSFRVGGSQSNYNGHISGTPSTIVTPELVGINTVVVNLGPKMKDGPYTTVGDYRVALIPKLDDNTLNAGWKMENLQFVYNGKTTNGSFDIPWGSDEDGRTLQVTMSFDVVGGPDATKPIKKHHTFDLKVVVTRGE